MRFVIQGLKYDTDKMKKLAFDTYRGLQHESRTRHNRRGSKKPFNEICTGYLRNRV